MIKKLLLWMKVVWYIRIPHLKFLGEINSKYCKVFYKLKYCLRRIDSRDIQNLSEQMELNSMRDNSFKRFLEGRKYFTSYKRYWKIINDERFQKYLQFSTKIKTYKIRTNQNQRQAFGFVSPNWRTKFHIFLGIPVSTYEFVQIDGDYLIVYNRQTREFKKSYEPK